MSEILNTEEVARLIYAEPSTVANLACRGELPATNIGKSYIFLREDVMHYVRERIARDTAERRAKRNPSTVAIVAEVVQHARKPRGRRARPLPVLPALPQAA